MSEPSDIRAFLKALNRWKLLVIAVVVTVPVGVYLYVSAEEKTYEATVLMQVQSLSVDTSLFSTGNATDSGPQTLLSAARLMTTTGVAEVVARELGLPQTSARDLLENVTATPDVAADFITLSARAASPEGAARLANTFADAVVRTRTAAAIARLNSAIGNVADQLGRLDRTDRRGREQLSAQLQRLRALRAAQGSNAGVIEPAVPPREAVSPRVARTTALAGILAVLFALGGVMLSQRMDHRIRDPLELEELIDRPLLSSIPRTAFGDSGARGAGPGDEPFQTLRASLTYFNVDQPLRSVIVTSPQQGDGKTTVATQLARAMARAGKDVILLDADLRRPRVASLFGVEGRPGLGAVLIREAALGDVLVEPAAEGSEGGRLRVLPAGSVPPNPSELLGSKRMQTLLQELSDMSDLVILDSPPLLTVSDLLPLVGAVSGVVVVARLNATSKDAITRLANTIAAAHGTLLGSVATGAANPGRYYGGREHATAKGRAPSGAAARLRRLRQPRTAPPA